LKRRLDQKPNAIMKTSVFSFIFGTVVALLIGAVEARDDGRYMQSPLKPWFDSLKDSTTARSLSIGSPSPPASRFPFRTLPIEEVEDQSLVYPTVPKR
jgi:hypothetical protein